MAKTYYIPRPDDQFLTWHDHFKTAATSIGMTLGIAGSDLIALGNDNTTFHGKVAALVTATAGAQQATAEKTATRQTVELNARNLAKRVKLHKNYTEALGEQLGIIGAEDTATLDGVAPTIKVKSQPNAVVELQFEKNKADGVNIYCQRGNEPTMTFLARDTYSPYVDNRPLLAAGTPEVRHYRVRFLVADAEVGEPSELTVTVRP